MSQEQASHDGDIDGEEQEIRWVGAQWLMDGYCGRATTPPTTPLPPRPGPTDAELRPVASVRRRKPWQARVVRIGPPRIDDDAQQKAA